MTRGFGVFDGTEGVGVNDAGLITRAVHRHGDVLLFARRQDAERWAVRLERLGVKCYNPPFGVREVVLMEDE